MPEPNHSARGDFIKTAGATPVSTGVAARTSVGRRRPAEISDPVKI